jgi:hypothetical protein
MRLLLCLVALAVAGCMSEFDQTKTKAEQGELFPFATAVVIVASLGDVKAFWASHIGI